MKYNTQKFLTEKVESGRVGSFSEVLAAVKEQIDFDTFREDTAQAEEISLIIAEMLCLPDGLEVGMGGDKIPIEIVKNIYSRLRYEHVSAVIDAFSKIKYEIKYEKAYLRKALYNSVFECESDIRNQVASDFAGCGK